MIAGFIGTGRLVEDSSVGMRTIRCAFATLVEARTASGTGMLEPSGVEADIRRSFVLRWEPLAPIGAYFHHTIQLFQ